jgi:hypothetical protein
MKVAAYPSGVGINDGRGQAVVLRSFVSSGPLDNYTHGTRLPE